MTAPTSQTCPVCHEPASMFVERAFLAGLDRDGEPVTMRGTWHGDGVPESGGGVTYTADPANDRASYSCPSAHSLPCSDVADVPALVCPVEGAAFSSADELQAHLQQHVPPIPAVA